MRHELNIKRYTSIRANYDKYCILLQDELGTPEEFNVLLEIRIYIYEEAVLFDMTESTLI